MNDNFKKNVDLKVVEDFGKEWQTLNQKDINNADLLAAFNQYFHLFPLHQLNTESIGFDMGCGSGRWSKFIAPKVKQLNCVDPSPLGLEQAKNNLILKGRMDTNLRTISDKFQINLNHAGLLSKR